MLDIFEEHHIEQVQALVRNLIVENDVVIASIFLDEDRRVYTIASFPMYIDEPNFCESVIAFALERSFDKVFIVYPSVVFWVDCYNLEDADMFRYEYDHCDIKEDSCVLGYYTRIGSTYKCKRLWTSEFKSKLLEWEEFDCRTLRRLYIDDTYTTGESY